MVFIAEKKFNSIKAHNIEDKKCFYEANIIEYFIRTLNSESGVNLIYKKSNHVADDGYMFLKGQNDIPIQLVQATDPELEKRVNTQIKQKGSSLYSCLGSVACVEKAIKRKVAKKYSHSKDVVLLVDSSRCDSFIDGGLKYLRTLPEVEQFRAVYIFYSFTIPKLVAVKEYKNN